MRLEESRRSLLGRWALAGWTAFLVAGLARGGELPARQQIDLAFEQQLGGLAARCDELGLAREAAATRAWLVPRDPGRQYLFFPFRPDPTQPAEGASQLTQQWHRKLLEHRRRYAEELFALALPWAEAEQGAAAYQVLHEVLWQDPQHQRARQALGAAASESAERIRQRAGTRRHSTFGWEARQHWLIESPHYRVTTSHSAQAGVKLVEKLELLHAAWRQVFFDYWSHPAALADRLAGGSSPLGRFRKHEVVLFRDRDEYIGQLSKYEPKIAMSLGYYLKGERTAFFYAGDAGVEPTWYHEATHQLFQEMVDGVDDVGERANFWAVEGIAVYMESLIPRSPYATLGGFDADRLQFARARTLGGEPVLPLAELCSLGRESLQSHAEIRSIYTHAAGLSHFFMDGQQGQRRRQFVEFVRRLYLGRDSAQLLAALCRESPEALDQAYRDFLMVRDDDLRYLHPPEFRRNLAFPHTAITDAGMQHLAGSTQLEWLDLSFTAVSDHGLTHLREAQNLRRLNLEGTLATDASLDVIGQLTRLEELDLSGLRITDAGVERLSGLRQLKSLWLSGTAVTDAGLRHLEGLKQLEYVEVSNTGVTAAGLRALAQKLPALEVP